MGVNARAALGLLASLACGLAIGLVWRGEAPAPAATSAVERAGAGGDAALRAANAEVERLREALAAARARQVELELELEAIELAEEERAAERSAERIAQADHAAAAPPPHGGQKRRPNDPWFDDSLLTKLGFNAADIDRIRARWEKAMMDRLYLTDERKRSGGGPKAQRQALLAFQAIENSLREDLGEYEYDAMRYATDQPNRVRLKDLLGESPAALAGAQPGDEVLRYDGERVYVPRQLQRLTQEGEPGEWVEVEVLRRGQVERLFVRRGPLGVQLEASSQPPHRD